MLIIKYCIYLCMSNFNFIYMFKIIRPKCCKLNSSEPITIHIKPSTIHLYSFDVMIDNVDKFNFYNDGMVKRFHGLTVIECILLVNQFQKLYTDISLNYYDCDE